MPDDDDPPIYRKVAARLLVDPDPPPEIPERPDGSWCEDRSEHELADTAGVGSWPG